MGLRKMLIWTLCAVVIAGLAYIRLAPSEPTRWHMPVAAQEDKVFQSGAIRVIDGTPETLQRLSQIALQTARTEILAGSVDDGIITFVTRSKWIGFPDYTTVQLMDGKLRFYARLRFGKADLGVNAARLEGWIAQL